ncbi:surfeit locus protein 6-domain-containing protein [Chytridium lagenaria]|nr:surfeit locus protein 6-domain-containing protein [Chytridium lagenaria]
MDETLERLTRYQRSFDDLINMIPLKYYMPTDSDDLALNRYAHNKKNKAPKQEIKEATRRAKRQKLDPEAQTFADVQQELASKAAAELKRQPLLTNGVDGGNTSASLPELREKLRRKIAAMRISREQGKAIPENAMEDVDGSDAAAPRSRQEILEKRLKRKKEKKELRLKKKNNATTQSKPADTVKGEKNSRNMDALGDNISFGKIESNTDVKGPKATPKKTGSDVKGLLKKAENKAKKLEALQTADPDKAKAIAEGQKWNKVLKLAEGHVVKDDLKLLKKTVKRKDKQKAKASKDWSARTTSVAKAQADKQKKRNDNLKARVENKGSKGKVSKSKPKKASRPGFEGGSRKKAKK